MRLRTARARFPHVCESPQRGKLMSAAPLVHECPLLTEELKASSTMQTPSLAGVGNVYRHHHQGTPSWSPTIWLDES
jgi:hypothetical protein